MKLRIIFLLFSIFSITAVSSKNLLQSFDRQNFYDVMKSGKIESINDELTALSSSSISEKEAYEGALLMRKAGLTKLPSQKLKFFKKGRIKLETALMNDNKNGEYHFLRVIIEEHAPKIVKYSADIETDKEHIKKTFKSLSPVVQHAIMDYSKNSNILH
ncbi:MAG: hypothetical protein JWP44_1664, partial [Mucilaginibacter sp.]|nr:hypothetical protein [Mucilaginibacter sp.]